MPPRVRRRLYHCISLDPSFWDREADPSWHEKQMWFAVIDEAYQCLRGKATATEKIERIQEIAIARQWFLSDRNRLGSFRWICREIGLNPEEVRKEVMRPAVWSNPQALSEPNKWSNPWLRSEPRCRSNPKRTSMPGALSNPIQESEPVGKSNPLTVSEPLNKSNQRTTSVF